MIILTALIFFIWLWGVLGALLAAPILVTFKIVCEHVPSLRLAAEFFAADSVKTSEAAADSRRQQDAMAHA